MRIYNKFFVKKVLSSVFVIASCFVAAFLLVSCSNEGESPAGNDSGTTSNRRYPEGYTTRYDGFTATVHWVENEDSGYGIYGRMFKPDDFDESKQYSIAIVCHGFNAVSEDGTSLIVQNYIEQGMLCYTFDFCGGGNLVVSEGETTDMSVETEIKDLEYVVDYIQSLSYVDNDSIVLTGKSFGGLVVATEAARNPDEFAGLVLFFPAITMYNSFHETWPTRDLIEALPDDYTYTDSTSKFTYGKQYYLDMFDLGNPLQYIANFDKPVIILQGDEDEAVNYELQLETVKAYGEENCEMVRVEGAGHNFSTSEYQYVMPYINAYLQRIGVI